MWCAGVVVVVCAGVVAVQLSVGKWGAADGAQSLVEAGAYAFLAVIGPGSVCTTRVVAGGVVP